MSGKQPQYKKKGDAVPEEAKVESPVPRGGRGGYRGGRGGSRGGFEGGDRPRTTGGDNFRGGDKRPYFQKRKEAQEGEGGAYKDGDQRDNRRKELDKNSWVYKFHYAERPQHDYKIEVTAETEVPPTIHKE